MEFRVLYQDQHLVAIHKPAGILVHRTGISADRVFVLQELRNQLGQHVYPVHRLDRGTSGVLVFALGPDSARAIQAELESERSRKTYLAIVRGWLPDAGRIDKPLQKDGTGELQEALTTYRSLAKGELPIAVDRYPTARYSLAEVTLHTGRMHQIRRHFDHLRHPVIGDFKHGDRHHNHAWQTHFACESMHLHAFRLVLPHPYSTAILDLQTPPDEPMMAAFGRLGWDWDQILDKVLY
ncbi:MAG: pseudouridine synthase [Bacteroidia bacterium]